MDAKESVGGVKTIICVMLKNPLWFERCDFYRTVQRKRISKIQEKLCCYIYEYLRKKDVSISWENLEDFALSIFRAREREILD